MYSQKSYKNASAETVSMDLKSTLQKGALTKKLWPRRGLNPGWLTAWFYVICGFNRNVAQLSVGLPYTSAFNML